MKAIAEFFRIIITLALVVIVAVAGCFTAIFFVSEDDPEEIFILDYALIYQTDKADNKLSVWFVKKEKPDALRTGDGIVYYEKESGYKAAYSNVLSDNIGTLYYDADALERVVFDESKVVGKILAVWQQK